MPQVLGHGAQEVPIETQLHELHEVTDLLGDVVVSVVGEV